MQNWKKVLLLLVVLLPSVFFVSRAFKSNRATVENDQLIISGAGGLAIPLQEIQGVKTVAELPELGNTGSFSLGLIKKGNFIRTSDQEKVRVIKNGEGPFIHLETTQGEIYFNLDSRDETREILTTLISVTPIQ